MIETAILNVVLLLLAGLALAVVVVLLLRWVRNDPTRRAR